MRSSNPNNQTRRERAQRLNYVIDRVLLGENESALQNLLTVAGSEDTIDLCNRIFRRATLLARHQPSQAAAVISARDRCVQGIYGHRTPNGWFTAWCDGSSGVGADEQSGLGVVLMDTQKNVVAEYGEHIGSLSPLAAELAALESAVKSAAAQGAERLRVYSDCNALIHLWREQREDVRLVPLRELAGRLQRLHLYLIPRRFNQPANRLARRAAK